MKSPWPTLTLMCAAVAAAVCVAGKAGPAAAEDGVLEPGQSRAAELWRWTANAIEGEYARAPALMLGLAVLLAVPPLAAAGLLARRRLTGETADERTRYVRRRHAGRAEGVQRTISDDAPQPVLKVWVEVQSATGIGAGRMPFGGEIVRIGRDPENDIVLLDKTVHRFHAAIHRTDEATYQVTDLSGNAGNGVLVNGRTAARCNLKDGDEIEVGQSRLKFIARPL